MCSVDMGARAASGPKIVRFHRESGTEEELGRRTWFRISLCQQALLIRSQVGPSRVCCVKKSVNWSFCH